jgi:hypothetical protein
MSATHVPISAKLKSVVVPAALAAAILLPTGAQALTGYQNAGSNYTFSQVGSNTFNFIPPKSFNGFDPGAVPGSHLNPQLYGFRYYIKNVSLGGSVLIGSFTGPFPLNYNVTPSVALKLDSIVPTSGPPVQFTVSGDPISGTFNSFGSATYPISKTVPFAASTDIALPPPVSNFTKPNNVTTDYYQTAWSLSPSIPGLLSDLGAASISGEFGLEYVYTYVPGPLPILGSAAAFGWSRRLRRRISKAAV